MSKTWLYLLATIPLKYPFMMILGQNESHHFEQTKLHMYVLILFMTKHGGTFLLKVTTMNFILVNRY